MIVGIVTGAGKGIGVDSSDGNVIEIGIAIRKISRNWILHQEISFLVIFSAIMPIPTTIPEFAVSARKVTGVAAGVVKVTGVAVAARKVIGTGIIGGN
uniref:Uncharacterized protein n=1 Tax=Cannabis sativa TaxID=3483 RepID=A0A803NVI3_CANSA